MPRFEGRAEFRRRDRDAPWVLAGVWVEERFAPADEGVDPMRARLPQPGLVGWIDLPPFLAPDVGEAGRVGLQLARDTWPRANRSPVPWASGVDESVARR